MSDLGEIVKSGPVDKAVDLLHRLAGPMFDEFGAILADRARIYRAKNLVSTVRKTERILREAGLPANAVPTRLLLPIMEASSVENTETLQEMWAGLLATASQQTDSVSPSFIETLKQLTPDEARHLEVICQETLKFFKKEGLTDGTELVLWAFGPRSYVGPKEFVVPPSVYPDTYERLGLIRRNYKVNSYFDGFEAKVSSEVDGWYEFTEYAIRFLDACHGPLPTRSVDCS
jgi:Abortive infection alpha